MSQNNEITSKRPLRVLHIAFTMKARGTETWLMNILRHVNRREFQMDFITVKGERGFYDEEIRSLGANLYPCTHPDQKFTFLKDLRKVIKEKGPYDIIHAHPYTISGLIMALAKWQKIAVRITHSHTDRREAVQDKSILRRIYICFMKKLILLFSTYRIAVSKSAALSLFGKNSKNLSIMHCGINLEPFENMEKEDVRTSFNIPKDRKIIGHIGGFNEEKNHQFLLSTFVSLLKSAPDLHLLLAGDGPLRQSIEQQTHDLNIQDHVTFVGIQRDIAPFLNIMDVFVFPSLFEGLGLALIEAQAAGVPVIASVHVPTEAVVIDCLVEFLPLGDADQWQESIVKILQKEPVSQSDALDRIKSSDFNIVRNIEELTALYKTLCTSHKRRG